MVVASPAEATAILRALGQGAEAEPWRLLELTDRLDLLVTGVGKTCAAGAVARALDPDRHAAVLSLGVAGALPGSGLEPGVSVLADASVFADEGVVTPDGFTDLAEMGFPSAPGLGVAVPTDPRLSAALAPIADARGTIATVSTCSGTDAQAALVVARTGAIAEAMEGAAVGVVTARVGVSAGRSSAFAEVRVISNTTGRRGQQRWGLAGALDRLGGLAGLL